MPDDEHTATATPGAPTATVTKVLWNDVTGAHLEELLYGLLEAMGASSLIWRAGATTGVTAADGGRDLEAVFDRPSPDGELDRQRWWVECKGRTQTVERGAVQQAVLDASARTDVDILVVATNSRFSNPTRDWVAERSRSFVRPVIRLWDRDNLNRLVRQYPTVAARVLPSALSDGDRLRLLVSRFAELGEEPTLLDQEFFWERQGWLMEQEPRLLSHAVAMFLYTEGVPLPRRRTWWRLLREKDAPDALIVALIDLPGLLSEPRPRPLEVIRVLDSAGRMLIACLRLLPDRVGVQMTLNPWRYEVDGNNITDDKETLDDWRESVLRPVLAFVQADLVAACSSDCARIIGDNPHEVNSLPAMEYCKILTEGELELPDWDFVMESDDQPCTVGLDVTSGCPLVISNCLDTEQIVRGVHAVLQFRRTSPDGNVKRDSPLTRGSVKMTFLKDQGMAWQTFRGPQKRDEP